MLSQIKLKYVILAKRPDNYVSRNIFYVITTTA